MRLCKRNLILTVCFAFMLSVALSVCVVACCGSHAAVCTDEQCAICAVYHAAQAVICSVKTFVITVIAATVCCITVFSDIPLPSPAQLTPVRRKSKQTI